MKQSLINKLPYDVIFFNIIPFTYSPQNNQLLQDIKHYIRSKIEVLEVYYNYYNTTLLESDLEYKYWIINDITRFINNYQPTNYGYKNTFYNFFYRIPFLYNKKLVDDYYNILENKDINTQINILWGLLTPKEREMIIIHSIRFLE